MNRSRAIVATSIGNMLEWYDFTIYALLAAPIAANFFPPSDAPGTRLVKTFLVFGAGFVVRPLGAVLLGQYADRAGRKASLTLSLALMAAGTALIAIAPARALIGAGAPLWLLTGRLLQGFSAGGEIGGATAFLLESAAPGRRGRAAAWLEASMGLANLLGALAAFTVTALLSEAQVRAWGWRLPFVLGLAIAPVGWVLRRSLDETAAFRTSQAARRAAPRGLPLWDALRHHGGRLLAGFCVAILWAVAVYVLMIFLPTYVQRADTFGFSARQAFGASFIGNLPFVLGCLLFGALSDRIGRRRGLGLGAALLLVGILPLCLWLRAVPQTATLIAVQTLICLQVAAFVGVAPAALAEIFPTEVRSTALALVYNGAFTLFGGFAPGILTWLTQRSGGSLFVPAWAVMAAATVALLAIPFLPAPAPAPAAAHRRAPVTVASR